MTTGPVEPAGGQDPDPPNVDLALAIVLALLADVVDALHDHRRRNHRDLLLRIGAVRRALIRLQEHRAGGGGHGG